MEKNLFLLAKNGNEQAKLDVIDSFMRLIRKKAYLAEKKLSKYGYTAEDFISIGTMAVLQGINSIKEECLNTAPGYIIKCINTAFMLEEKRASKSSSLVSLFEEVNDELTLEDMLSSDYRLDEDCINKRFIDNIKIYLSTLQEEDRELILTYFNNTYGGLKEYAKKYSLDYRKVRYRKDLLIEKIRKSII